MTLTPDEYRQQSRDGRACRLGPVLDEVQAGWQRRGVTHGVMHISPGEGLTLRPAVVRK